MMKKIIALVICVLLVVAVFAACSAEEAQQAADQATEAAEQAVEEATDAAEDAADAATDAAEPAATGESKTIAYLAYNLADVWNEMGMDNFLYCADKAGYKVITQDAQNDAEKQVSQAEAMINQGVDMITVFPAATESAVTIVRMCNDAGIPVAVENAFMGDDAGDIVAQVACQYADIGYAAVKYAAENIPDAKMLYVHGAPGLGVYEDYSIGVEQAEKDFADKIVEVDRINGEWATEPAYTVTLDYITKNGSDGFNVVFANNDLEASGVYQALKEKGCEDIPIISTGGSEEGFQLFNDGVEACNITAPVSIQGAQLFQFCYKYLNDIPIEETKVPLAVIPIDHNNADEWMHWNDYEAALKYVNGIDGNGLGL